MNKTSSQAYMSFQASETSALLLDTLSICLAIFLASIKNEKMDQMLSELTNSVSRLMMQPCQKVEAGLRFRLIHRGVVSQSRVHLWLWFFYGFLWLAVPWLLFMWKYLSTFQTAFSTPSLSPILTSNTQHRLFFISTHADATLIFIFTPPWH